MFHTIGMFAICPSASLNIWTEPQSEIGRNRGKQIQRQSIFIAQCSFGALERRRSLGSLGGHRSASFIKFVGWCAFPNRLDCHIRDAVTFPDNKTFRFLSTCTHHFPAVVLWLSW